MSNKLHRARLREARLMQGKVATLYNDATEPSAKRAHRYLATSEHNNRRPSKVWERSTPVDLVPRLFSQEA